MIILTWGFTIRNTRILTYILYFIDTPPRDTGETRETREMRETRETQEMRETPGKHRLTDWRRFEDPQPSPTVPPNGPSASPASSSCPPLWRVRGPP